jgi:hypothetical protein
MLRIAQYQVNLIFPCIPQHGTPEENGYLDPIPKKAVPRIACRKARLPYLKQMNLLQIGVTSGVLRRSGLDVHIDRSLKKNNNRQNRKGMAESLPLKVTLSFPFWRVTRALHIARVGGRNMAVALVPESMIPGAGNFAIAQFAAELLQPEAAVCKIASSALLRICARGGLAQRQDSFKHGPGDVTKPA